MSSFQPRIETTVRSAGSGIGIIDVRGELTAFAEDELMAAYDRTSREGARRIILNLEGLSYMSSSGIGLLVTLLIRVQRQEQRLLAYGLTDHYRHIFELTRLNEAITVCADEKEALAVTGLATP
jgi:anti-sigma B factor antagonist